MERWTKGTDGKIVIPSEQCLGIYNDYSIFFYGADNTGKTGAEGYAWKDNATLSKTDGGWAADNAMMINLGYSRPWFGTGIANLPLAEMAATDPVPANPTWGEPEWDGNDVMGIGDFFIPITDVSGQALNTDNLYFRLYFDGKLFDLSEVEGGASQTEFKYGTNLDSGIIMFLNDWQFIIFFEPLESIGVQSVYKQNGKE